MSEIDTDYLWLRQKATPRKRRRLIPVITIASIAFAAAAVWISPLSLSQTQSFDEPVATTMATATATPSFTPDKSAADTSTTQQPTLRGSDPVPEQDGSAAAVIPVAQTMPDTLDVPVTPKISAPATAHTANLTADDGQTQQPRLTTASLRFEPAMRLELTSSLIYNPNMEGPSAPAADGWIHINIDKGDTLSSVFERYNLSYSDSLAIANLPKFGKYFTTGLRVGDSFGIKADDKGHVIAIKDTLSPSRVLKIKADNEGYSAEVEEIELTKRIAYATGVIDSSFYRDAIQAGLSDQQVMELAGLFKWTIDFAYGIRPGDRFTVIYNELYKSGRKVGNGHILAASFHTADGLFRALRFTGYENETNYYRPDGTSLKRAFIRVPVDYTRISSPFTMARDHPILDTVRSHEGTDFAAPMGTPIHAAGDGRITFRGRNGGYGNMIMIDHGRGITTRYGHMSRFASGQSVGTYVKQGEVIGYVGSTGLSTGPHLHYEFRINDVPKDSQTVDLPGAPPLPDDYLDEFKTHVKPLLAQLKAASTTMLAKNTQTGISSE